MAGPFGERETKIFAASSLFCPSMLRYALIGLWIHDPRPEASRRLLDASSQARTSGSWRPCRAPA